MRKLLLLAAATLIGLAPVGRAADPTVTVRVQSLDDLIDRFEYLGGLAGQEDNAKQLVQLLRGITDPKKGLEGIDPNRPIGAYGFVTPDLVDSTAVVVVPIADEDTFLDLLRGRLALDPKKGDDGVYEVQVPNVPPRVFFRFAHKSLYVTARSEKPLAQKELVAPKELFAEKDDAVASVRVRLDRLPEKVRKLVIGQFELQVAQAKEKKDAGATPGQAKLKAVALDAATDVLAALLNDGKELAVRTRIEPTADEWTVEFTLTGKPGSPLAAALASARSTTGVRLPAGKAEVFNGGVRLSVPAGYRKKLNAAIDEALEDAVAQANDQEGAKAVAAAVAPTLKGGELDLSAVVTAVGGKPSGVVSLAIKEGDKIEKLLRQFAPLVPEGMAKIELDADKANGVALHKVASGDPGFRKQFGTDTIWLGISDTRLLASIEPDGALIRAAAKAGEGRVPPVNLTFAVARLVPLTEKGLPPERIQGLVSEVFPKDPAGTDTLATTVTGGDALTVKVTMKGGVAKLFAAVDKAKKQR